MLMDVKRDRLLPAAMSDSLLAILAAVVVALLVALHSRSFTYSIAVFLVLALSVVGSLAFYSFFTPDFPLLNLVIFVLLIAVGTDDAFLLFSHFPQQNLKEESFYEVRSDVYVSRSDPAFSLLTPQDVRSLASTLSSFRALPFINHSEAYWPEKFIQWSADYTCSEGFVCCNMSHRLFSNTFLDYCLRNSTSYIYTSYNDTPLFDNNSFALSGYTALLPTRLSYSHRFHRLAHSFTLLSALSTPHGWWAPEWALISTWYDLQRSIVSDVRSSVIVSTAVVAVFSLIQLRMQAVAAVITCMSIIACSVGCVTLLGWEIGVLEAVILVLVVGLSFDYTLHYGAALPKTGCKLHRILRAAQLASVPVSLSATTSFLAGASMLFSQTHAFSQVGVFLIVLTACSWVFATFFFLPLLFLSIRPTKRCAECDNLAIPSYPMDEKFHS
ncbi:SSD domain-containing protein [Trichostrongylus colubriformis]|uniref:SSD domain-containing protein n=2 Tax=Trichostrongylus colubriformis TaxID=6319 RepID=A0AAN8FW68_TRICO